MLLRLCTLFAICLLLACSAENDKKSESEDHLQMVQVDFDESKWKTKQGWDYPYREQMLNDILYNDDFRKLKSSEVLKLLGEPDRVNENFMYYQISQKRLILWPLHTRTMVIKFREDESIEWIKMNE